MKPINFISIEESDAPKDGQTDERAPGKPVTFFDVTKPGDPKGDPVTFFELTESGESHRTEAAVENVVRHEGAVSFFGISESEEPETETAEEDPAVSTVMVVEDDSIVSTMLKHLLERRGYHIEIAADGRRATELIDSDVPPALILLDVMLPFVDGFELIRKVREKDGWQEVPIIMLTAKTREEDIVRALESGANDYIVKPFQPQELIARVKRFVSQR